MTNTNRKPFPVDEIIHADCRHFKGDRPCVPHKREGVHCEGCPAGTHGYNVLNGTCDPMDDDTTYNGHGTHTAGTIAAARITNRPTATISPGARCVVSLFRSRS